MKKRHTTSWNCFKKKIKSFQLISPEHNINTACQRCTIYFRTYVRTYVPYGIFDIRRFRKSHAWLVDIVDMSTVQHGIKVPVQCTLRYGSTGTSSSNVAVLSVDS